MAEKICAPMRCRSPHRACRRYSDAYTVVDLSPTRAVPARRLASFWSRLDVIDYALDSIASKRSAPRCDRTIAIYIDGYVTDEFILGRNDFQHVYVAAAGSIPAGRSFRESYLKWK